MAPTDYTLAAGLLTINQGVIQTIGNKTITVEATGYNDSVVNQALTAGAFSNANSSAVPDVPYNVGTTSQVTLTARDQYNNPISGYQFKYSVNIDNANATTEESYQIDGQTYSENATFNGWAASSVSVTSTTDTNGQVIVTVVIPAPIDGGDGGGARWEDASGNPLTNQ